jgi:hypothetical protein
MAGTLDYSHPERHGSRPSQLPARAVDSRIAVVNFSKLLARRRLERLQGASKNQLSKEFVLKMGLMRE